MVVNCGIYTGKTVFGAALLLDDMLKHPGEKFWWVAGLQFQLEAMWESFYPMVKRVGAHTLKSPHLYAELPVDADGRAGAKVWAISAKNLDAIASHHPAAIYGDEVAKWSTQAWHLIRVRLLKKGGSRGVFLSTPRPNHWRELVRWGREHKGGRWGLIEATTYEAGIVEPAEIDALKDDLPEELFQQEILAKIVDGAGTVFRNVEACCTAAPEAASTTYGYTIGYDPAKLRDFAVCVVRRGDRVVRIERWSHMAYLKQAELVASLAAEYNNAKVVMDAGGPGEPVLELLHKAKVKVVAFTFDNDNKQELVNDLTLRFEQKRIAIPPASAGKAYARLVDELAAFERTRTRSGLRYQYASPPGDNDDCVLALMLAFSGATGVAAAGTGKGAGIAAGGGVNWISRRYND